MSKDYKRPEPEVRGGSSQLLVGILIGLVLGLGIALGVAWYINKMPNPFLTRTPPAKLEPAKEAPALRVRASSQAAAYQYDLSSFIGSPEKRARRAIRAP